MYFLFLVFPLDGWVSLIGLIEWGTEKQAMGSVRCHGAEPL